MQHSGITNRHIYFITMMEERSGHLQKVPDNISLERHGSFGRRKRVHDT
jgi:hypothetical protein